jgi:hypothetical protein
MDNSEARLDEAIPQRSVILPAFPLGDLLTAVPTGSAPQGALRDARITPVSWSWTSDPNRRVLQNKNLHHAAHDVMTATAPNVPSRAVRYLERVYEHVY